jgi:hypothetical protein
MEAERMEQLRRLVEELDRLVPREDACVRIDQFPANRAGGVFIGNLAGYMRFGIEFLKGALSETRTGLERPSVAVDLKYLLSRQPIVGFDEFILDESLESGSRHGSDSKLTRSERLKVASFISIIIVFLILACIGLFTTIRWLISGL